MRREYQVGACRAPRVERRAHFLEMPVRITNTVGPKVFSNFGEQQLAFWRIARARHTARRIGDNRRTVGNQPGADEGRERKEDRSWVASRIRDEVRVENGLTIELGEAIGYPFASVAGSQISRQINSAHASLLGARDPIF